MVLGVVVGLKNGELVMAGVVGRDCRDKIITSVLILVKTDQEMRP